MPDMVKFTLLLVFAIPAVFVSILIFIYFATHPRERSKPQNHVWFILLFVSFLQIIIHIPMSLSFYYLGLVRPATNGYCVWWNWFEHVTAGISLILMAWASIQRHLFIFYPTFLVGGAWKKWMYHRIPIILCISWTLSWYFVLIVISPNCTSTWSFHIIICGVLPCFTTVYNSIYGVLDTTFTIVTPVSLIILANIALVIRVIYEKISHHQAVHWGRHRKMVLQLWCISTFYLAVWLPAAVTLFVRLVAIPTFLDGQIGVLIYATNFTPLLLPFVCLCVFPEISKTIHNVLRRRGRNRIGVDLVPARAHQLVR